MQAVLLVGPGREADSLVSGLARSGLIVSTVLRHGQRSVARGVDALWVNEGIRPSEVFVIDACERCPIPPRTRRLLVADAPTVLRDLGRRDAGSALPAIPETSPWTLEVSGTDPTMEQVRDSWLAMVDGVIGTLGSPLAAWAPARREVLVAGVFVGSGPDSDLLRAPDWTRLDGDLMPDAGLRRVLDLRTGLLHHEGRSTRGQFHAVSLSSRARPGLAALRAEGDGARAIRGSVLATDHARGRGWDARQDAQSRRRSEAYLVTGAPGGVAVAASQSTQVRREATTARPPGRVRLAPRPDTCHRGRPGAPRAR